MAISHPRAKGQRERRGGRPPKFDRDAWYLGATQTPKVEESLPSAEGGLLLS
jgi:hypothetical protein